MEAEELKKYVDEIANIALGNPQFMHVYKGVSTVFSYLESEQRKREELEHKLERTMITMDKLHDKIDIAEKANLVVHERMEQLQHRSEKNGKLLQGVITALVVGIIMQLLNMAFRK